MNLDSVTLEQALSILGQLLTDRGLHHEVVAIRGGSLLLLRLIDRSTKDLYLVAVVDSGQLSSANPMPQSLLQAAEEVGTALELGINWLNVGPASLFDLGLPVGFETRMHTRRYGGLTIHLAGRFDQICFKLYASVDQGPRSKHFADLIALHPTREELSAAKEWSITHDTSEIFASELDNAIMALENPRDNNP